MFSQNSSKEYIFSLVWDQLAHYLQSMKDMGVQRRIPNISWNTARFFIETLREYPINTILEIGPANWFSTMILALAAPQSSITTLECSRHAFEELILNLSSFFKILEPTYEGVTLTPANISPKFISQTCQEQVGKCDVFFGDARQILPSFVSGASELRCHDPESLLTNVPERRFECIFIDGAFRMTRDFFDLSYPLLLPGGIMIIDDVIKYRWKMEGFHEYLESLGISYEIIQTDEDDGIMFIRKSFQK